MASLLQLLGLLMVIGAAALANVLLAVGLVGVLLLAAGLIMEEAKRGDS